MGAGGRTQLVFLGFRLTPWTRHFWGSVFSNQLGLVSGLGNDSGPLSPAPLGEGRCQQGPHNKIPQIRGLNQHILSTVCRLWVQGPGAGRVGFLRGLSLACWWPPSCWPFTQSSLCSCISGSLYVPFPRLMTCLPCWIRPL